MTDLAFIIIGIPLGCIFGISTTAMFFHHRRKMAELRLKEQRLITADIQAEFEKLRGEIRDLRDVSMQYDISFDTALQQMDRRLGHLERPQYGQHGSVTTHQETVHQERV